MWNEHMFLSATYLYFLLILLSSFIASLRQKYLFHAIVIIFIIHTLALLIRWVESYKVGYGHAPLSNYYESLMVFSWCITLMVLILRKKINSSMVVLFIIGGSFLIMAYANMSPSIDREIRPLLPALQSNWLYVHVLTCFLAYSSFFLSFLSGILFFFKSKGPIPNPSVLEEINHKSVSIGFIFLTAGILSGAVWAHYAWGSYWNWDPKETWSLITWIIYALYLHGRFVKGWAGKKMAILSIIGFMSVLFTYFGVNFLLSGLHSYAT
ncbi:MAG: cytochrome c biogenesis protein [Deltaproteobacteria bacterium]|nr:cytochrome c biogenesis protein [Deltaproteobacteria bacterium]